MTLPDVDTLSTLGGSLANASPVVDPTTDLDADADNKSRANVAMLTHTAHRAMRRFTGDGASPADPASGFVHDALWGNANANKPAVTNASTGVYLVTWPTTVQDELGASHAVNLRVADAWVEVTGAVIYTATARVIAANVVEVRTWQDAAPSDAAGFNVVVMVW